MGLQVLGPDSPRLNLAAQNIVPDAVTAAEAVSKLRTWASGRCLSEDQAGIYRSVTSKPLRNVARDKIDPMQN